MSFTYYSNIPNPADDPTDDCPLMQTNSGSIASALAVDHVGFNDTPCGQHNQVNFAIDQSAPPILGVSNLYANTISGQSWLYFQNALNSYLVLGPSTQATNGTITLPGGLIMKWGEVTMSPSGGIATGNVSFSPNFPTNCFNVSVSLIATNSNTSSNNTLSVVNYILGGLNPPATTGFSYLFSGQNSTNFTKFFWTAIGN